MTAGWMLVVVAHRKHVYEPTPTHYKRIVVVVFFFFFCAFVKQRNEQQGKVRKVRVALNEVIVNSHEGMMCAFRFHRSDGEQV